jgi:hypothetical protein
VVGTSSFDLNVSRQVRPELRFEQGARVLTVDTAPETHPLFQSGNLKIQVPEKPPCRAQRPWLARRRMRPVDAGIPVKTVVVFERLLKVCIDHCRVRGADPRNRLQRHRRDFAERCFAGIRGCPSVRVGRSVSPGSGLLFITFITDFCAPDSLHYD